MPEPSRRFFGLLSGALLALCTGYAALVLSGAAWAEARALDQISPAASWHIRPVAAADFERLRRGLGLGAGLLAGLLAGLAGLARHRWEIAAFGREVRQCGAGLIGGVAALSPARRQQAGAVLALLTALRLCLSLGIPAYDDAVSYELFVSKGLLATSAYYPIPNNHVLSNTLSLWFYQVNPGFWWSMRLPVLLTATGATVFLFAGLLRWAGFGVAAGATTLFSGLQLSLYHAGVGRGYWLLILLAGAVFFSTLVLTEAGGPRRAAWAALIVAGALGCYAVPTFVYVLASAFSWLGLAFLRRRRWAALERLVVAAAAMGAGGAALYAPLLLVSGWGNFVGGRGYVAAQAPGRFWANLPAYVWHNEGFLAGQRLLGSLLTLPTLALLGWLLHQAQRQRLPTGQATRLRRLGWPALWFVGLPYAVILGQRVFPPERVLLYKAFFFFILAGLVVEWLLWRWPAPAYRWALGALTVLFMAFETYSVGRVNPGARGGNATYRAGVQWLAGQPPGPVLIPETTHNVFFRFYAHAEMRQRTWQIDNHPREGTRYAYVVAYPNQRGFFHPRFGFPPAYKNQALEIYRLPGPSAKK